MPHKPNNEHVLRIEVEIKKRREAGVYEVASGGAIGTFHGIKAPTSLEMSLLLGKISERTARLLEQSGYLEREEGDGGLLLEGFQGEVMNQQQQSQTSVKLKI